MRKLFCLLLLLWLSVDITYGQLYSIVIKGGWVIDPKNNINAIMDVAVENGKIATIQKNIDIAQAKQVVDATNTYVVPGLVDIHGHVFYGAQSDHYLSGGVAAISPDGFTFRTGVTTIVDAGGAGYKSFDSFKKNVIDQSKTRVFSFLNIVGEGMRGGAYEQNLNDMDAKMAAATALQYKDNVVGFKVAHFVGHTWAPVDSAVEAAKQSGLPVMIDFGGSNPQLSLKELFFHHLRPGDIFTHTFGQLKSREAIVDLESKKLKPFVKEAQEKGIIFDVGYGGISFNYSQAIPALKSGFFPNTISSDIHSGSMNHSMKDILNVMSKFRQLGMSIEAIIKATTWSAAQAIKHEELGNLSPGSGADIAILTLREGDFGFFDYTGYKVKGNEKFECEVTVRDGKIVYDLNGRANPIYVK